MLTRGDDSPEAHGLIVPKTKDGRVVFLLPWLGAVIAGTTDAPAQLTMEPRATLPEVDFILDALGDYSTVKPRREDVLSAWSGIRPLAADPTKGSTENITRDHVLAAESGLLTITGGKWTTYRKARAHRATARALHFADGCGALDGGRGGGPGGQGGQPAARVALRHSRFGSRRRFRLAPRPLRGAGAVARARHPYSQISGTRLWRPGSCSA